MYESYDYRNSKGEVFREKMLSFGEISRLPELLNHIRETIKNFQTTEIGGDCI